MKLVAATALAVTLIAGSANAEEPSPSVNGIWSAKSMGGVEVEIAPCGDVVCGTFAKFYREKPGEPLLDENNEDPDLRSRPLVGVKFIEGMQGGPTEFTGGKIYYPNTGSFYDASLTLASPDELKLKVCLGTTCREQSWARVQ